MRRLFGILIILSACSGKMERKPAAENLLQLDSEPIGCRYLYKLDVEAEVFNRNDAVIYLENRIAEQNSFGNAYWITNMETKSNDWSFFGKDRAFVIKANVYNCPASVVTRMDAQRRAGYIRREK